jgi:hypothetical protein
MKSRPRRGRWVIDQMPAELRGRNLSEARRSFPCKAALAWLNFGRIPNNCARTRNLTITGGERSPPRRNSGIGSKSLFAMSGCPWSGWSRFFWPVTSTAFLFHRTPTELDWGNFYWDRFSAVRFGRSVEHPAGHLVTADQVANMMLALDEARRHGYERIGFIGESEASKWIMFEAGFLMAQQKVLPRLRLPIFRITQGDAFASRGAISRWLKKEKPDAVLTSIGEAPDMLKKAGYRVPEDIGLAAMSVLDGHARDLPEPGRNRPRRRADADLADPDNVRGVPPLYREILIKGKWVDGSTLHRLT